MPMGCSVIRPFLRPNMGMSGFLNWRFYISTFRPFGISAGVIMGMGTGISADCLYIAADAVMAMIAGCAGNFWHIAAVGMLGMGTGRSWGSFGVTAVAVGMGADVGHTVLIQRTAADGAVMGAGCSGNRFCIAAVTVDMAAGCSGAALAVTAGIIMAVSAGHT